MIVEVREDALSAVIDMFSRVRRPTLGQPSAKLCECQEDTSGLAHALGRVEVEFSQRLLTAGR